MGCWRFERLGGWGKEKEVKDATKFGEEPFFGKDMVEFGDQDG